MSKDEKTPPRKMPSAAELFESYKLSLARRIVNGDINLADELAKLTAAEERAKRKLPSPVNTLKPRRRYTFSEAAHEARVNNSKKSTGPTSAEGRASSSQNARKAGGVYAASFLMQLRKPCKSTCDKFADCEVVGNGQTRPGGACLDKVHFLEALEVIGKALKTGKIDELQELMAVELAGILHVKRELQEGVDKYGGLMETEVLDELGRVIQREIKLNPAIKPLLELMRDFGITLRDQNLTPAQIVKHDLEKEGNKNAASLLSTIMQKAPARK